MVAGVRAQGAFGDQRQLTVWTYVTARVLTQGPKYGWLPGIIGSLSLANLAILDDGSAYRRGQLVTATLVAGACTFIGPIAVAPVALGLLLGLEDWVVPAGDIPQYILDICGCLAVDFISASLM